MALNARLNLRQSQSMTVTPQLLQSIRLLQYTQLELQAFINSQIEQNPLLENADADNSVGASDIAHEGEMTTGDADMADVSATSMSDTFDSAMDNVYPDDNVRAAARTDPVQTPGGREAGLPFGAGESPSANIEDYVAGSRTLKEHVTEQCGLLVHDGAQQLIAAELIDALDDRGYLDVSAHAIGEQLGCKPDDVLAVLAQLQNCEPAGLFARNLAECLALQCARAGRLDPAMKTMLDHLDLLARRDFASLRKLCGVDDSDLIDMLSEIRGLDPHPGRAFDTSASQTVVHDVSVTEQPDGTWRVELNPDTLPRVLVNRDYHATLMRQLGTPTEKSFIAECYSDATWLERSLEQRAQTILKVATEIVRQQDAFLVEGVRALKPMTMRMVADQIGMHESTVSRVVSNKYMMTARGLFEMRYFFTVALNASESEGDNAGHSSEAVRQKIRDLIDAEESASVLSDDTIVARLRDDGVDIARRTVAKYREAMGIASSVQRRREKKARMLAAQ